MTLVAEVTLGDRAIQSFHIIRVPLLFPKILGGPHPRLTGGQEGPEAGLGRGVKKDTEVQLGEIHLDLKINIITEWRQKILLDKILELILDQLRRYIIFLQAHVLVAGILPTGCTMMHVSIRPPFYRALLVETVALADI